MKLSPAAVVSTATTPRAPRDTSTQPRPRWRNQRAVGSGRQEDAVLPAVFDQDHGDPGFRLGSLPDQADVDPVGLQALAQAGAVGIGPDLADHDDLAAQAGAGHRLVGALAAGQ